jgi:mycofactocin precursor
MTDPSTTSEEPPAGQVADRPDAEEAGPAALVEADLLVEEISIDGMCGVY